MDGNGANESWPSLQQNDDIRNHNQLWFLRSSNGGHQNECSICLEDLLINGKGLTLLACGHQFHMACVWHAFRMKGRMECPVCRDTENSEWEMVVPQPETRRSAIANVLIESIETRARLDLIMESLRSFSRSISYAMANGIFRVSSSSQSHGSQSRQQRPDRFNPYDRRLRQGIIHTRLTPATRPDPRPRRFNPYHRRSPQGLTIANRPGSRSVLSLPYTQVGMNTGNSRRVRGGNDMNQPFQILRQENQEPTLHFYLQGHNYHAYGPVNLRSSALAANNRNRLGQPPESPLSDIRRNDDFTSSFDWRNSGF